MNLHVLEVGHQVVQAVVDDVYSHVSGPMAGFGDGRVDMDLDVQQADCWGAEVDVVGKLVASDCQANAMCFGLVQIYVPDEFGVGDCFTLGNGLFGDKKDCVGAFDAL